MYTAVGLRQITIGQKVREIVDTVCGSTPVTLVSGLLDYRGFRPDELRRIRELLDHDLIERVIPTSD